MQSRPLIPGAFITLEGADGAGKTTQLVFIQQWMREQQLEFVCTREPGGSPFGEALREILLDRDNMDICDEAELLTVFAARKQHLESLILPALECGKWVLSDRFTDASYAYQGGGRGIDRERIEILENWVQGSLQPDLTILLDIDVSLGSQRSGDRDDKQDRFERASMAFKAAVRQTYLERAAKAPGRIKVVDASGSIAQVQAQLKTILQHFFEGYQSRYPQPSEHDNCQ